MGDLKAFITGGRNEITGYICLSKSDGTVEMQERAKMLCERQEHAICCVGTSQIIASGGESLTGLSTAELYDLRLNSWKMLPKLNVGRSCHASCSIERQIFVICGMCQAEKNSIECLDLDHLAKGWELILLDISPRSYLTA